MFAYFARDLPDTDALWRNASAPSVKLLASDGAPIPVHGVSAGAPVRLSALPRHVPEAILAVEDRNFYHHFGANPISLIRALIINIESGAILQGGSTITQQLAKNIFLSGERTAKRKIQELLLAIWLEQKFTKDEILTLYLNRVYFGAGAYGIDAASHRYFGKPATLLTIGEAAVLAGLLKAPSRFAPTTNPASAGRRGRLVIRQMVDAGFLTEQEAASVIAEPVILASPDFAAAPYFIDFAIAEAKRLAPGLDADLVVQTTFDRRLQAAAEDGLAMSLLSHADEIGGAQVAVAIIEQDGAVRALIGGKDYQASQFNRAVYAKRQPGSAFKPFVYLAGVEAGMKPDQIILDAPINIGGWAPDNYKSKFYGRVSMREALARSLNSAAVRVQERAGRSNVRKTARSMGWAGSLNSGPALALGVDETSPLALARAYAPFANGGYRVDDHVVTRIKTNDGDLIYRGGGGYGSEAASREAIEQLNAMMRDVALWGSGRNAAVSGWEVAGKTGTTQNSRDAWFAGHAGGLICVVWVGRDDNAPMPGVTGGRAPAIIWREIMSRALPPIDPYRRDDPIGAMLAPRSPYSSSKTRPR